MKSWNELKQELGRSPEAQAGYEKARAAYEFGKQVRELREARGWSQAHLASLLGTTQSAIARLEAGGSDPRLSTIQRMSALFGVPFTVGGKNIAAAS